jgi:hypothetical protein
MKKYILFALVLVALQGCFDSELVFEDQFIPVVEAYIYEGKAIERVKVSSMISFGDDTTGGTPIEDLAIYLYRGDESWDFVWQEEDSTYALEEMVAIAVGDSFSLQLEVDGLQIESETVVPEAPPAVSMNKNSIRIERVNNMQDFRGMEWPDPIEFSWANEDAEYYFFVVQNIEAYEDQIVPDPPDDMPFKRPDFNFQMVTRPTNDTFFELMPNQLTHYGTYEVIVYSVNDEYVNLYNSMDQDSRELNEPYTNIEGGLGIFTAFSSDTLYFEVED